MALREAKMDELTKDILFPFLYNEKQKPYKVKVKHISNDHVIMDNGIKIAKSQINRYVKIGDEVLIVPHSGVVI